MRSIGAGLGIALFLAAPSLAAETRPDSPVRLRQQDIVVPVDAAALKRQHDVLSGMPSVRVRYARAGSIRFVRGETGIAIAPAQRQLKPGASGQELLSQFQDILLGRGTETLTVDSNRVIGKGYRVVKLAQSVRGVPVLSGGLAIGFDEATGLADSVQAQFLPDRALPAKPRIPAARVAGLATELLVSAFGAARQSITISPSPSLAYYGASKDAEKVALVWVIEASYQTAVKEPAVDELWIDAVDGSFVGRRERLHRVLSRSVFSANNNLPGPNSLPPNMTFLFSEGGSSGDAMANTAYHHVGTAHNVWAGLMPYFPYPGTGVVVHVGRNLVNAFSIKIGNTQWLMFGDGSIDTRPLGDSLDAVAHEFGHGVNRLFTGVEDGINNDSRALAEFYADLSSVVVDAHQRGGAVPAPTWEIAEVFHQYPDRGLRSWRAPNTGVSGGRDWYPRRTMIPGQATHQNSTIAGHAYYLLVNGGVHYRYGLLAPWIPSIPVPSQGQLVSRIVFLAAMQRPEMLFEPDFFDARDATGAAGDAMHPALGAAVRTAWRAVGVGYDCSGPPARPIWDVFDFMCKGRYKFTWNGVPGATTYHGERVRAGWPWALAATIVDGPVNSCTQQVRETSYARLRACNGCGCSDWTDPVTMQWWQQCP
jgi:Zn-dependent metalloprotease